MRRTLFVLLVAAITALSIAPAASAITRGPCIPGYSNAKCLTWEAKIPVVDDGDTVQARIMKGNTMGPRQSVRVNGLQSMEILNYSHGPKRSGQCHAVKASARLAQLVQGKMVRLTAVKANSAAVGERYRLRRSISFKQGGKWVDAGAIMIQEGWALPFPNQDEWASNGPYLKLAQEAAARKRNLWNPSGCGTGPAAANPLLLKVKWDAEDVDSNNLNGEWVRITNTGATAMSLGGWMLRDSHFRGDKHGAKKGRGLTLPNATIPAGGSIRVHVGRGSNSATDLYWGLGESIFGNATNDKHMIGDGAYLFDPKGNLRAYSIYPCLVNCSDPLAGKVQVTARYNGVEYEWIYVKNTSAAPISLYQYELESSPWFYEFDQGDVVLPGKSIVVFIDKQPRTVPPRNGAPAIVPTRAGLVPFGDTQPGGFRAWGHSEPLLSDNKDVVTLRSPGGDPVTCAAWGGERCPTI
jgi:endonuclease YncB( thermonuclease family)